MTPFERRMTDSEAARLLRVFVLRAAKKTPPRSWNRWVALVEAVHRKVCVETCSWDEVLSKIEETRPTPERPELHEVEDEPTPAQTPAAKDWERSGRPWWRPW